MSRSIASWLIACLIVLSTVAAGMYALGIGSAGKPMSDNQIVAVPSYDGSTPAQNVNVTVEVSPAGSSMDDVTIAVTHTDSTVLLPGSFTTTITPSNRDVNVTPTEEGAFVIEELDPGETVEITFAVIPRSLAAEEIPAARIEVTYVQQGQRLSKTLRPNADISSNPWVERPSSGTPRWMTVGGAGVAALFGILVGAFVMRSHAGGVDSWRSLEPAFSRARRRIDDTVAQAELERLESSVREQLDATEEDKPGDEARTSLFSERGGGSGEETGGNDNHPKL